MGHVTLTTPLLGVVCHPYDIRALVHLRVTDTFYRLKNLTILASIVIPEISLGPQILKWATLP